MRLLTSNREVYLTEGVRLSVCQSVCLFLINSNIVDIFDESFRKCEQWPKGQMVTFRW